jgi:WD40 repeat protein
MQTRTHSLSQRTRAHQVAEKYRQDIDRITFAVVVGAGVATGTQEFRLTEFAGRERASTGLLKVGGDVLSHISTFLSWEKVKLKHEWKAPGGGNINSCYISPCSTMILTSSGCGNLHLWDAAIGHLKQTFKGHNKSVKNCRFFPNGKTVVSASDDKTLKVWDIASGSLVRTLLSHTGIVTCVDVSPDNTRILSGSCGNSWKMWSSRTGEWDDDTCIVLQHTGRIGQLSGSSFCCSFSPNGHLVLVGCDDNLRLHDSHTYQLQHTLTGHSQVPRSCSFAPEGATIVSGSQDSTMKIWSTATGQCLHTIDGHSRCVCSCSFSPGGHAIYSASHDGSLMMWTAASGTREGIIDADTNSPWSICASPNGKYIVSGHSEGAIKTWQR